MLTVLDSWVWNAQLCGRHGHIAMDFDTILNTLKYLFQKYGRDEDVLTEQLKTGIAVVPDHLLFGPCTLVISS